MATCRICGDEARDSRRGNAATCESCKAFFFRNAFKPNDSKCSNGDNCVISVATRKKCKSCRLKKCLEAGMMKEWKIHEEQSKKKCEKEMEKEISVEVGPPIKLNGAQWYEMCSTDGAMASQLTNVGTRNDGKKTENILVPKQVFLNLISHCQKSCCDQSPLVQRALQLYDQGGLSDSACLDCVCKCECSGKSEGTSRKDTKAVLHGFPNGLSMLKIHRIEELLYSRNKALEGLASELDYGVETCNGTFPYNVHRYLDCIKTVTAFTRRVIEMGKYLGLLQEITQADQVTLLTSSVRECVMMTSVFNYSHELDAWQPLGKDHPFIMKLEVIKLINKENFEPHYKFVKSFHPSWKSDLVIVQSLMAICLFEPTRQCLRNPNAVQKIRNFYCDLLIDHLCSIYGNKDGRTVYDQLMKRMEWLSNAIDIISPYYFVHLCAKELRPLMIDILPGKPRH